MPSRYQVLNYLYDLWNSCMICAIWLKIPGWIGRGQIVHNTSYNRHIYIGCSTNTRLLSRSWSVQRVIFFSTDNNIKHHRTGWMWLMMFGAIDWWCAGAELWSPEQGLGKISRSSCWWSALSWRVWSCRSSSFSSTPSTRYAFCAVWHRASRSMHGEPNHTSDRSRSIYCM